MASRYWGLSRGVGRYTVSEASSSPGKHLEVSIDLTKNFTRPEFLQKLDEIFGVILSGPFPAATAAEVYKAWYISRGQTQRNVTGGFPTKGTGTVTNASVLANDTFTFDGTLFTAKTGSPGAAEWDRSLASDTLVAADLVRVFNATAATAAKAVATSALGVVTFTPVLPGTAANSFTLASSNSGRLAVSAATLLGGTEVTGGDMLVKLLSAGNFNPTDLMNQLDAIKDWALTHQWPPA